MAKSSRQFQISSFNFQNMNKLSFIFILSSLFFYLAQAQAPRDNFIHFTEADGLPSSTISVILQDRFGYIWIGTNNGLVRYDGYSFKHYNQDIEDDKSIQITLIYSLYEDKKGELWIGGVQGYSKYNREYDNFTSYSLSHFQQDTSTASWAWLTVRTITEDEHGTLLFGLGPYINGNNNDGLFYLDDESNQLKKYPLKKAIKTNSIITSLTSKSGVHWFAGHAGLFKLNTTSKDIEFYRPDNFSDEFEFIVLSIAEDNDGSLWIGTMGKGLYNFNPEKGLFKRHSLSPVVSEGNLYVEDIFVNPDNNLWLATSQGLLYYTQKTDDIHKFIPNQENPSSINSTRILSITNDFEGSVWIATFDKGLNRYDAVGTDFQTYVNDPDKPDSFGPGWAVTISEDDKNDIWIGLGESSAFVNYFNRQQGTFKKVPGINGLSISTMFKDSQNKMWAGTWGGNYLYQLRNDKKGFLKAPHFPHIPRNAVLSIFEDSNYNICFGLFNGLWLYNKSDHSIEHIWIDSLNTAMIGNNNVYRISEDQEQNLWLGTNNGLYKYDRTTNDISRIGFDEDKAKSFLTQDINALCIDKTGIIWAGTWLGGLNKYDPKTKTIRTYTIQDGLPSNSVQGIIEDEVKGSLWLSTFKGLSRFDIKTEKFHNYDIKDGVHANEFADGAALKTSDGSLIFGGSNGITMFKPEDINESTIAPKIFLTDFKLSNEYILPGPDSPLKKGIFDTDEITLNYDQNDITFEYTGIHFVNAQANKYAYKLENYEDDLRYVGSQRNAIYPNLPPGHYTFRVKAANYNSIWNEEGVKLSIIINPPLWATWWAYVLYVLFGFGLLYSVRRLELKRRLLQAENKRKTEELEEARQLQLSMLPKELPQLPNLDIAVYMQTATEVGGDYYDFHVALDGTLTVVIGDATGHGMKAGTMVTTAKSLFNSYASNPDILFSFSEFTRCIKNMNFGRTSMCLTMLKISDYTLQISTAGMPPTYIYRQESKKVEEYLFKGMPLGAMEKFPYELKETKIKQGDTLLLLSDGLPELENSAGEIFGYNKVLSGFGTVAEKSPEDIISYLKNEGSRWVNNAAPDDDVTFVVIKVK